MLTILAGPVSIQEGDESPDALRSFFVRSAIQVRAGANEVRGHAMEHFGPTSVVYGEAIDMDPRDVEKVAKMRGREGAMREALDYALLQSGADLEGSLAWDFSYAPLEMALERSARYSAELAEAIRPENRKEGFYALVMVCQFGLGVVYMPEPTAP